MKVALAAALVFAASAAGGRAYAEDTFEARAAGAQRLAHVDDLVWALTAPCDHGDDTERRQCRLVRDRAATGFASKAVLVDADADAFQASAYDPLSRATQLSVSSCIRCAGVPVDGKTWYLFAGTDAPRVDAQRDRVVGAHVFESMRLFADADAAAAWAKQAAGARVEMLVRAQKGAKPWTDGKKLGLPLELLAFRVVARCDGVILASSVKSGPAAKDAKACAPTAVTPTKPTKPVEAVLDELSMRDIREALKPAIAAGKRCFQRYGQAGMAKVKLTVSGDGAIERYAQLGDLVGTPEGDCIDKAMKDVKFPPSKREHTDFVFPIDLR